MKKLIFIGGPMGVGKTTLAKELMKKLPSAVYLDGDWCWYTNPWILNEETRKIVILNASDMLKRFIESKSYQTIIFTWILYDNSIIKELTDRLPMNLVTFYNISLIADENTIVKRLEKDISDGIRPQIVIPRSKERLKHYPYVDSIHVDTTGKNKIEVLEEILSIVNTQADN